MPVGTKTAASLPSRSQTRASSFATVGSSPKTSSPQTAAPMAARIARELNPYAREGLEDLYKAAGGEDAYRKALEYASEALKAVAAFRLALPRTMLRFAGGREITLGDLGAKKGILGGINAVIVGNYLTTLGRPAEADLELLDDLQMPIKALNATL